MPPNGDRLKMFTHMTCNQFLSGVGEPTRVEAAIGRIYNQDGLEAAFAHIEEYTNTSSLSFKNNGPVRPTSGGRKV